MGHREGDKQQHSSSASELCVHVCMQTHLHLGGPCVCGALLSEGTIPCCVLLSCRCQLCPLNSYVSLCKVSVQPCGRKLSSESILLYFHNPFCYKSLTATPNQTPLRSSISRSHQPYKAEDIPISGFQLTYQTYNFYRQFKLSSVYFKEDSSKRRHMNFICYMHSVKFYFINALQCVTTPAPLSILQGQEGVASALAACKILREMSRLETKTEVVQVMKEAKYEQLAVGKLQQLLTA